MTIYDRAQQFAPRLIELFKNPDSITHLRSTDVDDGGGGVTSTTSTIGTYQGAVIPASGAEIVEAGRREKIVSHKIYLKPKDGSLITEDDAVKFQGRQMRVTWVEDIAEAEAAYKIWVNEGQSWL